MPRSIRPSYGRYVTLISSNSCSLKSQKFSRHHLQVLFGEAQERTPANFRALLEQVYSLTHSPTLSHTLTHSFTHSLTHPLSHSLSYSHTHSLTSRAPRTERISARAHPPHPLAAPLGRGHAHLRNAHLKNAHLRHARLGSSKEDRRPERPSQLDTASAGVHTWRLCK